MQIEIRNVAVSLLTAVLLGGLVRFASQGLGPEEPPVRRGSDHPAQATHHYRQLAARSPELVLLGNSMLGEAVDEALFRALTGVDTYKLARNGSASAWWYIALKNVIAPQGQRRVAIFFRDHFLTEPAFRATGSSRRQFRAFVGPEEPVLERFARARAGWTGGWAEPLRRLLGEDVQRVTESAVKSLAVSAAGLDATPAQIQAAKKRVFAPERMIEPLFTAWQLAAEASTGPRSYDFDANVEGSFLPHMIELARRHELELLFVRVKRRAAAAARRGGEEGAPETPELRAYIGRLRAYLARAGIPLLDYTDRPEIRLEHYAAGDHLDATGRALFTRLLARDLARHLGGRTADRPGSSSPPPSLARR